MVFYDRLCLSNFSYILHLYVFLAFYGKVCSAAEFDYKSNWSEPQMNTNRETRQTVHENAGGILHHVSGEIVLSQMG